MAWERTETCWLTVSILALRALSAEVRLLISFDKAFETIEIELDKALTALVRLEISFDNAFETTESP